MEEQPAANRDPFGDASPQASASAPPTQDPFGSPFDVEDEGFEVDLAEAESRLVPDGNYEAKVVDLSKGYSQAGNSQWIWDFALTKGEYAGKEFRMWTALTPSAMWKVAQTLEALGFGAPGELVRFKKSDVIGRMCVITLQKGSYNGQERMSVNGVAPSPAGRGAKAQAAGVP